MATSFDEYSPLERAFVARARHAHAWAEAFVDGRWILVDTTPSLWVALEQENHSSWQIVQDYLGWFKYQFDRFRRLDRSAFNDIVIWFVPPLLLLLLWRLRKRIRPTTDDPDEKKSTEDYNIGDKRMGELITLMRSAGYPIKPGHTLRHYLYEYCPTSIEPIRLRRMLDLYERQRFSRYALSGHESIEYGDTIALFRKGINDVLRATQRH